MNYVQKTINIFRKIIKNHTTTDKYYVLIIMSFTYGEN